MKGKSVFLAMILAAVSLIGSFGGCTARDPAPSPCPAVDEQEERILFIGDAQICGLRDEARLGRADYFCDAGMTVFDAQSRSLSELPLWSVLAEREYHCVVVSFGSGTEAEEGALRAYGSLLSLLVRTQPQATIALQGVPGDTTGINGQLASMAESHRVEYLEPPEDMSHWTQWICEEVERMERMG